MLQSTLDCACAGSTIWLLPPPLKHDAPVSATALADIKIRRPCLCITTFPAVFSVLPANVQDFLIAGGGEGLCVGVHGGRVLAASQNSSEGSIDMKQEESRWMRSHVQLNAVSVRAAHVFFSCIRFFSYSPLQSAEASSSSPPALRISNGGCAVVLIDCDACAPASAAIVCHVKQQLFDSHRSQTPSYFSDPRSAPGSPTFRTNALKNKGSSSPVFPRTGTPTSDGGLLSHGSEIEVLDVLTLLAWRCKVLQSAQGVGCVRASCMLLQCTLKHSTYSACEAHGHGARLQLLRCVLEQCSDSMLICNSGAWLHATLSFIHRCATVARCVDHGSLVLSSCALENVNRSAVTVTQASSIFCSSCFIKDVGLEYAFLIYNTFAVFILRSDVAPLSSWRLVVAAACCWTQCFAGGGRCLTCDVRRVTFDV
jgi:hypothetical protein